MLLELLPRPLPGRLAAPDPLLLGASRHGILPISGRGAAGLGGLRRRGCLFASNLRSPSEGLRGCTWQWWSRLELVAHSRVWPRFRLCCVSVVIAVVVMHYRALAQTGHGWRRARSRGRVGRGKRRMRKWPCRRLHCWPNLLARILAALLALLCRRGLLPVL